MLDAALTVMCQRPIVWTDVSAEADAAELFRILEMRWNWASGISHLGHPNRAMIRPIQTDCLCKQVKGETRLPTLPLYRGSGSSTKSTNCISLLESSIITWTKQINNVLKQDPKVQLKLGFHPTPDVEIMFWKNKANNLD